MKFGKLFGLVCLLLAIYLLWNIRFIVLLSFTAIALATLLNRVVQKLNQWGIKRGPAIIITFAIILTAIAIVIAITVPPLINQISQWLNQAPFEINQISHWLRVLEEKVPPELSAQLNRLDTFIQDVPRMARGLFNNAFFLFRGTLSILINLVLVIAITVMLLANPKAYRRAFISLFPKFYRNRLKEIIDHCEVSLVGWGVGIIFNMIVITVLSFIGLVIIDIPLPIANAFIAGILTFIPNVGPILSVITPAFLGLLEAPWKAFSVILLYIFIQQLESNFLTPLVMKHQVSLLPAIALISQLICGVLFGFIGLFLALPLVVIGQVLLQDIVVMDIMNRWSQDNNVRIEPG